MENVSVYLEGTDHMESLDMKAMGARVRKAREDKKLTREKFSEMIEVSVNFVADVEYGKKSPSCNTLFRMAQALDVSVDYLLSGRVFKTYYDEETIRACEEVEGILRQCDRDQLRSLCRISSIYSLALKATANGADETNG